MQAVARSALRRIAAELLGVVRAGVIELYGLPYDSGAVPQHLWEPSLISGLVAFIAVVGVSGGATYGLLTLNGYFDKK